jgi:hypothetical protein
MSWKASSQVLRRVWLTAGRAARFGGAFEEDLDLDVAAGDALAYRGAEGGFDGVEFHGHVEMEVEAAVVDGFDGEREFTGGDGARHAGEAGHAANGHGYGVLQL